MSSTGPEATVKQKKSNAAKKRDWVYLSVLWSVSSVVYLDPWQETKKKQAKQWSCPGILGRVCPGGIWFMVNGILGSCSGLKFVGVWE